MLKLILGRAGSGKSENVIAQMAALANEGRRSLLIVPEQSSYSFERELTLRLTGRQCACFEVKSFRRLCGDIFAECGGGGALPRAAKPDKCALVRRAMLAVSDQLNYYKKHRRDGAFFALASDVFDELENGGVTPDALRAAALAAPGEMSRGKLDELALLFEAYNALRARTFLDEADELTAAARRAAASQQFSGVTVFLDGYTGFTEPEHELLRALLEKAQDVVVTLCCDDLFAETEDALAPVRAEGRQLLALARRANVPATKPLLLADAPRFCAPGLAAAEQWFLDGTLPPAPSADGLFALDPADLYDEARQAAAEILFLAREKGYAFADIVVIARDTDRCRNAVERTFERCGIPLFSDATRSLLRSGTVTALLAALQLSEGPATEPLLRLLKTGLTGIGDDTVCELENYCFVWNIDGGAWFRPFTDNPDGFGEMTAPGAAERLARLESARGHLAGALGAYVKKCADAGGQEVVAAAYALLDELGLARALEQTGDEQRREAALGMELYDRLYRLVGDERYTAAELCDMASLLASSTAVGELPPGLEQVTFGAADRIRTNNPRAVFLLGLNEGIFPRGTFDSPLLTMADRELLMNGGAELSRSYERSAAMEKLYLYRAATCARERVYFSCPHTGPDGAALLPATELSELLALLQPARPESLALACPFALNERTAGASFAEALEREDADSLALLSASSAHAACARVAAAAGDTDFSSRDAAVPTALLGGEIQLSATKLDQFGQCRFAYFLKYMMHIQPLQKAEINPLEAGSFVHSILENTLRAFGGEIAEVPQPELRSETLRSADAYIDARVPETARTPRTLYLIARLRDQSVRLMLHLQHEQQQSDFRPVDYELSIGPGEEDGLPPVMLHTPTGETVYTVGKIDRVDVLRRDGKSYLRVVDYKTGDKEFSLTDVYYGLNIQMLLYLFTACRTGGPRYGETVPAGVLYLPSDPSPGTALPGDEREVTQAYRMSGLLLDDEEIVRAMEKDVRGVFIPVTQTPKGNLRNDALASLADLGVLERRIDKTVTDMAASLLRGEWDAVPCEKSGKTACDWCDYFSVCRHDRSEKYRELVKIDKKTLFADETEAKE